MDKHQDMHREIERYLHAFNCELRYKQASFETLAQVLKRVDFTLLDEKAMNSAFIVHA